MTEIRRKWIVRIGQGSGEERKKKEETILDEEADMKEREIVQEPEIIFIAKISL